MMKTKLFFAIVFLIMLSSCVKDYIGHGPDGKEVELTSENYLYDGNLERFFLEEQISRIDDEIAQLDEKDPKREELLIQQSNFKQRIAELIDESSIGLDFPPIPCDLPNGKCIPRLLELFTFTPDIKEAVVYVKDLNGKNIGVSNKLIPLPNFEKELQYIRVPVTSFGDGIVIEIAKKDEVGKEITYKIALYRK